MVKLVLYIPFLILVFCFQKTKAQTVEIVKFSQLNEYIHNTNDTTYIFNFFASWCAPCIKDIPDFVDFAKAHQQQKVKVIFVSLDFKKDIEKNLFPLINKLKMEGMVYLLDETNANVWISEIDQDWSGTIPATLIVNTSKKYKRFLTETLTIRQLEKLIP